MRFIKENPALAAGIGLPILLIILFGLAAIIPKLTGEKPHYDALFSIHNLYVTSSERGPHFTFAVENDHLNVTVYDNGTHETTQNEALYVFDADTQTARQINVPESIWTQSPPTSQMSYYGGGTGKWWKVPIPETASWQISTASLSPDGYEFHNDSGDLRTGGGLMWDLFMQPGYYDNTPYLKKDGRVIKITYVAHSPSYPRTATFLGWAIAKDKP